MRRLGVGRISKDILYDELALGRRTNGRGHLRYNEVCMGDMEAVETDPVCPGRALQLISQWGEVPRTNTTIRRYKVLTTSVDNRARRKERRTLINPYQHGFLKARSRLTNMLCFFEEITKWVDEGSPVDVIHLDFQKTFNKVPHQRLILKLKPHGMGNSVINLIEQWLTDRRQRVVVDGKVSSWKSVLSGVPQWSVLGPILLLVYMYRWFRGRGKRQHIEICRWH